MTSPLPNLRHLAGILAVAETGSLSAAAETINLSQPALTQGLSGIESRLAVTLFSRTGSGMATTEAGRIYLRRIERGFALLRSACRGIGRPGLWRVLSVGQIRALVATVDHGAFRSAAVALGRRVSTISRACRDLEKQAGTELFEVTSRGLRPVLQAETFARYARLALKEFHEAETDLRGWQGSFAGDMDIGCLPLAQTALLPAALNRFAKEYPAIAPRVVDGLYQALARDLQRGELDFIIGALRHDDLPGGLRQVELFADPLWVVARAGHPLALAGAVTEEMLAGFPWVAPRKGAPARTHFAQLQERLDVLAEVARPVETGSHAVLKALLTGSDRLTVISTRQVRNEIESGELVQVGAPLPDSERTIGYTHREDWLPSLPQTRFLELLRNEALMSQPEGTLGDEVLPDPWTGSDGF